MANFFENVHKLFNDFRSFVKRKDKPIGQADLFSLSAVIDASLRTDKIETLSNNEQLTAVYKSIFDEKQPYVDTFKSFIFQEMGRDISNNPRTSIGMAQQIYSQMEKFVSD